MTFSQWNASVRDNLLATSTAITTAANCYTVGTGPNARAERFIVEAVVDTVETTSSTSFTSLATNGPLVSPVTGSKALVFVGAQQSNSVGGTTCYSSYEVSGATTIGVTDAQGVILQNSANQDVRSAVVSLVALTAGTNTFRMLYRCGSGGGTGSFSRRHITVMPL